MVKTGLLSASMSIMALLSIVSGVFGQGNLYPDPLWVKVIFYDYNVPTNGANPDFQNCMGNNDAVKGMVYDTLDKQRKPVPTPFACPSNVNNHPCACHLKEWFRVSGSNGSDPASLFVCDSTDPKRPVWSWTNLKPYLGRTGEYTGSNWDATYNMRNIIIYDSLPFSHLGNGIYQYKNNSFFKIDGRGFGAQPSTDNSSGHNFGFAMELHTVFTYKKGLTFAFVGDDDVWAYVNGKLVMDLGGVHGQVPGSFNLDNVQGLVEGQSYSFDFFYAERHTTQSNILITSNIITAMPMRVDITVQPNDTIKAGDTATITGTLYDQFGKPLPASFNDSIKWTLDPATAKTDDVLTISRGNITFFTAKEAHRSINIIGRYGNSQVFDTAKIYIIPNVPCRLVIEQKGALTLYDPQFNLNLDTLRILSNEQQKTAYSLIRDCYGNYIRYGNIVSWGSIDTTVVSARAGDMSFGEGVAVRNPAAILKVTRIHALDTALFRDSCFVKLEDFYYTRLRIVIDTSTNPDSLVMNTNQDTTIKVQGLRSSDNVWVDVSATWQNRANLKIDPTAPVNSFSWTFSPSDTGRGWIRATMNNDNLTKPDSVQARFFPGPPVRASIEIITPPDSIIAGKPTKAVVVVYDKDGHSYTYTFDTTANKAVAYRDTLETGVPKFPGPFIIVDGDTISLAPTSTERGNQAFINGRDTVSFTLYNSPYNAPFDTMYKHLINGNFIIGKDTIRASSPPFVLHPDKLAEITIVYPDGTPVTDTLRLTDPIVIIARGYDKYGNRIGDITGTWSVTDSLHQITDPLTGSSITYDPRSVIKNERGYIFVNRDGVKDSIYVIIAGQPINLVRAVTRDISGNGILDRMELYFSRKFELPANASFTGLTIIANGRDTLVVNRILNTGSNTDDSVWVVELVESHTNQPQTGWTPSVHLPSQSAYDLADRTVVATDGAGPVVWRVENHFVLQNSHGQDTVVVTFSEPVQRSDGGNLTLSDKPVDIFYVWTRDPAYPNDTSRYILVKDMLAGTFLKHDPGKSNSLVFTMNNGNDLNRGYFLSLADSTNKYVSDTTVGAVRPNTNNIPRRVVVIPVQKPPYIPFNPIGPVFTREGPGIFNAANNENALTWVRDDRGRGAVIIIPVSLPPDGETEAKLKFIIKIYDVIGNVVQSNENPDFLDPAKYGTGELKNQSGVDASIYWNGSNEKGMAVAPGVYRVVMYLKYSGLSSANKNNYKDKRMVAKLGIQR